MNDSEPGSQLSKKNCHDPLAWSVIGKEWAMYTYINSFKYFVISGLNQFSYFPLTCIIFSPKFELVAK